MPAPLSVEGMRAVRQTIRTMATTSSGSLRHLAAEIVTAGIADGVSFVDTDDGRVLAAVGTLARGADLSDDGLLQLAIPTEAAATFTMVADLADTVLADTVVEDVVVLLALRLDLLEARARALEAERHTRTLSHASQVLGQTMDVTQVLEKILGQLKKVVPFDSASVQLLEDDTNLRIIGVQGFDNSDEILTLSFSLDGHNPNKDVISSRATHILKDAATVYPHFNAGPHRPAAIRGWMGVPLTFKGELLGMLTIDSQEADFYNDAHARTAEAFAAQAAVAIANARMYGEMQRLASHDTLTGLPNRRHLEEASKPIIASSLVQEQPLSLLMIDVDHFKQVNDSHGHAVGDEVLVAVADRLRQVVRPDDLVARVGGEEFVVLLAGSDLIMSMTVAERLRAAIAARPIATEVGDLDITVSVGGFVCEDPNDGDRRALKVMMDLADKALYNAKAEGRNCTVVDAPLA
ncbi:sensor domain-containing diguanylate cyclase [Euzebya tangerina]|uniref:GGDEF domain-containing protein n=1 Tax=Euzebya tangerina TaxID=591198 RepID=UPI000E31F35C|nr:sensor domain-containing diguanylate cyclase [Euzebya tangerina]